MSEGVGKGFSLVMELKDPAALQELMIKLDERDTRNRIRKALGSLDYVHYARFLPLWERGLLLIVTEFDGSMKDYVMDFAMVLDDEFSLILGYMKDCPRLPVSRYPDEFWAYVDRNTGPKAPHPAAYPEPFCAYPGKSVLDIAGGLRAKTLPSMKAPSAGAPLALDQVQGNVIFGFRAERSIYHGFCFEDPVKGRALVGRLSELITWTSAQKGAAVCVNLGLTHSGLAALGVPEHILGPFPEAYRQGVHARSERLGDVGRNAAQHWTHTGLLEDGTPAPVHGMVVVSGAATMGKEFEQALADVSNALNEGTSKAFGLEGRSLPDDTVHFGYRDGISQPRPGSKGGSMVGDIVLGRDYPNSRGGHYIGELLPQLASNGTYAALRVIEQDVAAFEDLLSSIEKRLGVKDSRELIAAKLMGRWRDGSALVKWPEHPDPEANGRPPHELDDFDYAGGGEDDREGRRCPFGAHVRRLNPRGGMVLGVPIGRRVVRRGMPYGDPFDSQSPQGERGLIGLFLCADLESQFEFIQHAWANGDLSAPGLRNSQDVFAGARDGETPFTFRLAHNDPEVTVMVPPLTRVRGSAYFFMPSRSALQWMGSAAWTR